MAQQVPVAPTAIVAEAGADGTMRAAADIAYRRLAMVNVVFVGRPAQSDWVLIDAGLPGTADLIAAAAAERFGQDIPPRAIVLTHGHFDHVGTLETLAERWNAPVYAHPLERPYLDGSAAYPPPDPAAGGGALAWLAPPYPR